MPGDAPPLWKRLILWPAEALAIKTLVGGLRLAGVEGASAFGAWLVGLVGPRISTHRTVLANLAIAFPNMPAAERQALAREVWRRVGRGFAETLVMDRITEASGRIEIVGRERLEAIRDSGRPAVFVSGHFANFEVMAAAILCTGVPCRVTYRPANNPHVDAEIRRARARYGMDRFAAKGEEGARELLEGLKRGESVALMNDQKFAEGPEVLFFGHPAATAPGPTRLALRFGAPIVPMSVERLPGVRFRVTVHPPLELAMTGDRPADILAGVQAVTDFIEAKVRAAPADWFWVHRRWADRVYAEAAASSRA